MLKRGEWILLIFNVAYILWFLPQYIAQENYEFIFYIGVLVIFLVLICAIQRRVRFSYTILWMLSLWGLFHMLGGGLHLADGHVLYRWVPVELYNAHDTNGEFVILKFDQVLHFYIYFVMSFVVLHLLRPLLPSGKRPWYVYGLVVIASMGLSIINELVEFSAVIWLGRTGVGGYFNTMLDFVFNTLGALVGGLILFFQKK